VIENAIRAARLDVDFYNAAERDETLTGQAAMLVAIVSFVSAFGIFWLPGDQPFFGTVIWSVVAGLVGWVVWAALTSWIGRQFFEGQTNLGEMLRVLGFAQAPRVLGFIPWFGWIGAIWALVASVIAIREGQDFTTGKAVGTAIVGWLILVLVSAILPGSIL
jgi:hypothetical protein